MHTPRWTLPMLLAATLVVAGCVRLGFDDDQLPNTNVDGGSTELGADLGDPPDAAVDQVATPDAALPGQYEGCSTATPCSQGLDCIQASSPFCMRRCAAKSDCGAGEVCDLMLATSGYKHCMLPCTANANCPVGLSCAGFGPYPGDHCAPLAALGKTGDTCTSDLECTANTRCIHGYSATGRCYQVCPKPQTCPSTHLCFDMSWESRHVCQRKCAPLDSPSTCASYEICYPNPPLAQAYCINGTGDPKVCTTTGKVCVSSKICVGGVCQPVCDATHPCLTGQSCSTLNYSGKDLPWKACK